MSGSFNFYRTVHSAGLGPSQQQALDAHWSDNVGAQELPQGKLAIDLDGSWLP